MGMTSSCPHLSVFCDHRKSVGQRFAGGAASCWRHGLVNPSDGIIVGGKKDVGRTLNPHLHHVCVMDSWCGAGISHGSTRSTSDIERFANCVICVQAN